MKYGILCDNIVRHSRGILEVSDTNSELAAWNAIHPAAMRCRSILTKRICKCLMQIADLRQNPTAHASLHYPANLSNMLEKGITENKYIIRIQAVITSTQSAATHRNYSLHRAEENKILRCCSKNSRTTTNYTYRGYDFLLRCSRKSEIGWSANPTRRGSEYEKPK